MDRIGPMSTTQDRSGQNGPNRTIEDRIGPISNEQDRSGHNGPNRTNVDQIEPKWPEWTKYDQCGLKWIIYDQCGPNRIEVN